MRRIYILKGVRFSKAVVPATNIHGQGALKKYTGEGADVLPDSILMACLVSRVPFKCNTNR